MTVFRSLITLILSFYLINFSQAQTRYIDSVFDSVSKKTYTYSKIKDISLKLDFYQPTNDTLLKRPVIVLVHGGGFSTGSRENHFIVSTAENIAKKGYVVASVDYTLLHKTEDLSCNVSSKFKLKTIEKATQDVAKALMYLVNYKEAFNIDDTKVILYGSSAGAEIILNLAYNKELVLNPKYFPNIPKISAVISLSGAILDASLINKTNAIPGVFYHGTLDPVVPYYNSSHHSCSKLENGYLPEYGSKAIVEVLERLNSSYILFSYLKRKHDIFNLPYDDFHQAFKFIKRVVIDDGFYQANIVE